MLWIKMSVLSLTGGEKCSLDSYNFMEKTAVQTDFKSNSGGGTPLTTNSVRMKFWAISTVRSVLCAQSLYTGRKGINTGETAYVQIVHIQNLFCVHAHTHTHNAHTHTHTHMHTHTHTHKWIKKWQGLMWILQSSASYTRNLISLLVLPPFLLALLGQSSVTRFCIFHHFHAHCS